MKKTSLMLLTLAGFTFAAVGCSSNEAAQAPETAQVTADPQAGAADQTGAAVQTDPAAQGADTIQAAPAESVPAQPAQ